MMHEVVWWQVVTTVLGLALVTVVGMWAARRIQGDQNRPRPTFPKNSRRAVTTMGRTRLEGSLVMSNTGDFPKFDSVARCGGGDIDA